MVDESLIPVASENNCHTYYGYRENASVCSCEPHCSWDLCRLVGHPISCLQGTRSKWQWSRKKNAWVAQIVNGIESVQKLSISKQVTL